MPLHVKGTDQGPGWSLPWVDRSPLIRAEARIIPFVLSYGTLAGRPRASDPGFIPLLGRAHGAGRAWRQRHRHRHRHRHRLATLA
jgi:hypothetical protein